MSARFEIVRTDAKQPWHARFVAHNGRIVWTTEQYSRVGKAEGAITSIARALGVNAVGMIWNVEGVEKILTDPNGRVVLGPVSMVRYVDERSKP